VDLMMMISTKQNIVMIDIVLFLNLFLFFGGIDNNFVDVVQAQVAPFSELCGAPATFIDFEVTVTLADTKSADSGMCIYI